MTSSPDRRAPAPERSGGFLQWVRFFRYCAVCVVAAFISFTAFSDPERMPDGFSPVAGVVGTVLLGSFLCAAAVVAELGGRDAATLLKVALGAWIVGILGMVYGAVVVLVTAAFSDLLVTLLVGLLLLAAMPPRRSAGRGGARR